MSRAPRVLRPPSRPLPPETILLENGSTTFVSSLEEFIDSQSSTPAAPILIELEEEDETNSSDLLRAGIVEVLSGGEASREEAKRPAEVAGSGHNKTIVPPDKSSKLAIVFTPLPPADQPEAAVESGNIWNDSRAQTPPSVLIEPVSVAATARSNLEEGAHHEHAAAGHSSETAGANKSAPKPIQQHWQVKSLLNVTHDYPLAYSQVICGYVWPLMAAITLFTNLMIVFVLTQHDMRTPTNVVLTAIAIADIIPIVVPVPWFIYLFAMGNEKQVLYPPVACYFYQHSTRSVSEIFYFLSTWLNVLLAIQDYLTACQPKLAKKYCQIRVVVIEIVLLTLSAFLLNLPQALKVVFKPVKFYYNGELTWGCKALQARWFKDLVGDLVGAAIYDDVFTAIIVVFVDGGPALLLITLTTLLIRQLQRRRIQGHKLMEQARTASKRRRERHRQQEYESSARVMIFVLLAFLAVKIPFATTYTLMIIQSRFGVHFVDNMLDFQKAITLTDLVFVLSYPINFTIFCCCSKKFRHKCAQLLGECNETSRSTRDRLMSNLSGSFNSGSLANSISRRFSSASKCHSASQPLDGADSLEVISHRKGSAPKKLSLAEYANNAQIPTFRNYPQQQQQAQHAQHAQNLDARSLASSRSSFSSTAGGLAEASRKLSHSGKEAHQGPRRPTRACTGCEQQRRDQHQQQFVPAANHDEFKRLLEEGSLCLECIVCYERIRSDSSLHEADIPTGSVTAVATGHANSQPEMDQEREAIAGMMRDRAARRTSQASDISASFSLGVGAPLPPPPPPPKSLASFLQQRQQLAHIHITPLPQIVTTACEDFRERSSLDEVAAQAQEVGHGHSDLHFSEIGQPSWEQQAAARVSLERQTISESGGQEVEFNMASRHSIAGSKMSCEHTPSSQASHLANCSQSSGSGGRVSRSKSRDTNDYEPSAGRSLTRPATAMMTRASCSDPGDMNEQAARGQQQTPQDHQRADRSSGLEDGGQFRETDSSEHRSWRGHRNRADSDESAHSAAEEGLFSEGSEPPCAAGRPAQERTTISEQGSATHGRRGRRMHSGQADSSRLDARREHFGSRQRSLSLSNSNLTTLPNATGMLADVLVTVLFGGAPTSDEQKSTGTAKRRHQRGCRK